MSLLQICKDAADEVGIDRPASIVGNSQSDPQKLLRYAKKVGIHLMKKVAWQILRKEQTFTSILGETQTGILPADFDRFIPETFWDRSATKLISGPITAEQWQSLKANSYAGDPKFIYRGGSVLIIPAPSAGNNYALEYVSNQWCQSALGVAQTSWIADTDTGILDEELITLGLKYVYLTDEGLPNAIAAAEFNDYFGTMMTNDQPDSGVMVAADIFGGGWHYTGVPGSTLSLTN